MSLPHSHVDPDGLQEFSVVFTDRSLNHMSQRFQGAMRDISGLLKEVYGGSAVALIPGGGSYAMEAVARQFGQGRVLVVRNGWFSYRWSQIFDACGFGEATVVMARAAGNGAQSPFAPPPLKRSWRAFATPAPRPFLPPMLKPARALFCLMVT